MSWYMTYCCGMPYSGWHCNCCGYDTLKNERTFVTTNVTDSRYAYKGASNKTEI